MHFALILVITCAQMLVIYILGDSSNPPAGLGMYSVYFMAALLGWIAFTLQQGSAGSVQIDVGAIAIIINSYVLFLAAGQRAGMLRGRIALGGLCLGGSLGGLLLSQEQMFVLQVTLTSLFFLAAGIVAGMSGWRQGNIGDGIIGFAGLSLCASMPLALYYRLTLGEPDIAQAIAFGAYSAAYVLVAIGFLASVLIEYQGHLALLSTHDPLSRVYNRRGMDEAVQLSLAAANRHEMPTAAIMVDVDHFNDINNSFGPGTGDLVIRKVAEILQNCCRDSDVVARVDGEKFMLVMPETNLDQARLLAERIRLAIGERPQLVDDQRIAITVSVGVASSQGDADLDTLALEADQAMQLAKQAGRNQVASIDHEPVLLSTSESPG